MFKGPALNDCEGMLSEAEKGPATNNDISKKAGALMLTAETKEVPVMAKTSGVDGTLANVVKLKAEGATLIPLPGATHCVVCVPSPLKVFIGNPSHSSEGKNGFDVVISP